LPRCAWAGHDAIASTSWMISAFSDAGYLHWWPRPSPSPLMAFLSKAVSPGVEIGQATSFKAVPSNDECPSPRRGVRRGKRDSFFCRPPTGVWPASTGTPSDHSRRNTIEAAIPSRRAQSFPRCSLGRRSPSSTDAKSSLPTSNCRVSDAGSSSATCSGGALSGPGFLFHLSLLAEDEPENHPSSEGPQFCLMGCDGETVRHLRRTLRGARLVSIISP